MIQLVDVSMKKLRELIDTESKKMIIEFAKDVSLQFDALLRVWISSLQNPQTPIESSRIEGIYGEIKTSFLDKYKTFYSADYEKPDDVFFSIEQAIKELQDESNRVSLLLASKPTP